MAMTRERSWILPSETRATVLVVDDDEQVRDLLVRVLLHMGYRVAQCRSAPQALEQLEGTSPDLVLLDVDLAGDTGHVVLDRIRSRPETRLLPVIMITGAAGRDDRLRAIRGGVTDFVVKPFDMEELMTRVRSLLQLKLFTDALEDADKLIFALAQIIDARDPYTAGHSERVSFYAGALGRRVGLGEADVIAVRQGGLFHDLGKIAVRDHVLLKPGKLTAEEYRDMQRHPVVGRELLQHMKSLDRALPVVYQHHERLDGSGYPQGLSGDAIPVLTRIATIVDVYDALTTDRPYRAALAPEEALGILDAEARRGWWDRGLLEEFRAVLEDLHLRGVPLRAHLGRSAA